jgi:hypothetical protein
VVAEVAKLQSEPVTLLEGLPDLKIHACKRPQTAEREAGGLQVPPTPSPARLTTCLFSGKES